MFMLFFTWSLLAIAAVLLIIQVEVVEYWTRTICVQFYLKFIIRFQMKHGNVVPGLVSIFCGLMALFLVFINCELGQRITDAYERVSIAIEHSDWYLFPNGIQRILPMIIANAQHPVELECFGSIKCNRDVYKNVGIEQSTVRLTIKILDSLILIFLYASQIIHRAYEYFMVLLQLGN